MEPNSLHQLAGPSQPPAPYSAQPPYHHLLEKPPYHHLLEKQHQELQMFWNYQRKEIEKVNDFKNHKIPLARIKKIMKADEDVRMISVEAPILFAKACEFFILELTIRSWIYAEENKRRTLQKNDITTVITRTEIFDFLADIFPSDEIKDEAATLGEIVGPPLSANGVTGVPYYYSPMMGQPMMGQPAVPEMDPGVYGQPAVTEMDPGVYGQPAVPEMDPGFYGQSAVPQMDPDVYGQPAVLEMDPGVYGQPAVPEMDPGVYGQPPSQAWQFVWQNIAEDGSYASGGGGSSGHGSLDGKG